jgi:hypothetical protein
MIIKYYRKHKLRVQLKVMKLKRWINPWGICSVINLMPGLIIFQRIIISRISSLMRWVRRTLYRRHRGLSLSSQSWWPKITCHRKVSEVLKAQDKLVKLQKDHLLLVLAQDNTVAVSRPKITISSLKLFRVWILATSKVPTWKVNHPQGRSWRSSSSHQWMKE